MITGQLKRVIELQDNSPNINLKEYSNIISFFSGKGGTGKSVLSILSAISLTSEKKKVLLLDLDLGFPNINVLLNQHALKSLDNYLFNNQELGEVISEFNENLHIIFGYSNNPIGLNSTKFKLKSLVTDIKKLSKNYDYVILDCGAGLDEFKLWVLRNSGVKVIVATNDPSSIMDAYALIKIYEKSEGLSEFFLILNRCETTQQGEESFDKLQKAVKSFLKSEVELLATITENDLIKNAVLNQGISEFFNNRPDFLVSLSSSLRKLNKYIQLHNINHSANF